MKKQLVLGLLAVTLTAGSAFAQEGAAAQAPAMQGRQMKSPAERTKEMLAKLQNELPLSNEQAGKAYQPFFNFYEAQQKMMDEMRASGNMDREAMKAKRDNLAQDRNKLLADIFTADQMAKFKEMEQVMMKERMKQQEAAGKP